LASATFANSTTFAGITETDTYNSRLQPIKRSASSPSATIFSLNYDFHLSAGDNGSVYQIVNNRDSNRTQNFTYDALNRLSSAYTTSNLWGTNFVVDAWGNLTNMNPMSGKVDSPNLQAAPATTSNQLTGFGYDAAGNLTSNGSATYTYNAEGQLKATGNATYTYDGDGNRVKKMVGSTGTIYWRGLDGEIANETDAANVILHRHVFFAGRRVSRTDNQPSWSAHFYFSDNLGSANVVTNATGAIEDESDYYPYGGERVISNVVPQNYKFTAKERDPESGLDEFGARYYANSMGRFMTPDWSEAPVAVPYAVLGNPQTLNLYSYVENNPATGTDPDGHADNPLIGDAAGTYDCGRGASPCPTETDTQKTQPPQQSNAAVAGPVTTAPLQIGKTIINFEEIAEEAAGLSLRSVVGVVGFIFASSEQTANEQKDTIQGHQSEGSPEPQAAAGGAGARQGGGPITGFTKHGINQAISRDGVGVANHAILDAVKNPKQVVQQSGGRTMYVGRDATVITNAQGKVISTWANGSAGTRIP
jgi:RHS repeat-associated protein